MRDVERGTFRQHHCSLKRQGDTPNQGASLSSHTYVETNIAVPEAMKWTRGEGRTDPSPADSSDAVPRE